MLTNIVELNNDNYVVIDMDSGTVLGTNLVLVQVPDEDTLEEILNSDSEAFDYGQEHGVPLTVDL